MSEISKNLQNHINNPHLYRDELPNQCFIEEFQFAGKKAFIRLDAKISSKGELQVNGFSTNLSKEKVGFLNGLFTLLQNRKYFFIASLSPREIENFFRDTNSEVAYQQNFFGEESFIFNMLRRVQKCLSKCLGEIFHRSLVEHSFKFNERVNVLEKISVLNEVSNTVYKPIFKLHNIGFELVEIWEDDLYYELKLQKHFNTSMMKLFIHEALIQSTSKIDGFSKLNWVAEPE